MWKIIRLVEAKRLVSILMMLLLTVGFLTLVPTMAYAAVGAGGGEPAVVAGWQSEADAFGRNG